MEELGSIMVVFLPIIEIKYPILLDLMHIEEEICIGEWRVLESLED